MPHLIGLTMPGRAEKYRAVEPLNTLFLQFINPSTLCPAFSNWSEAIANSLEGYGLYLSEDDHRSGAPVRLKTSTVIRRNIEILHATSSSALASRRGKAGESCLHIAIYGFQVTGSILFNCD